MADGTYRCPDCKTAVTFKGKVMEVYLKGRKGWPVHNGCELAKPLDQIDFDKLEKTG
ncbi:hypothetical protein LCGC14_1297150 [marine sediment metagenome]|uniref:Uncharacterized protein n=1 Tax=marine sediment metagenome TaxID=412755 RepID=A0A0F9NTK6_9ZZZZ